MQRNDFSSDFSIVKDIYYLNHAAVSPWPVTTADVIKNFADENAHLGATQYLQWLEVEQALRENIRLLLNAPSSDDIAIVKNTSEALSMVANGLSWKKGDNIVIAQQEFPSNRIVWQSLQTQGVDIKLVDLQNKDNSPEEQLFNAVDNNTRLISVSSVQYADGLRMNLKKIGEFCQQQQILFCVDAIQSLGALSFDVQAIHADFVMADGHKWLMSPEGTGLFYCRDSVRQNLKASQYGWHMVANQFDFDALSWTEAATARKFECGSPNMLGIHALNSSIKLILDRKVAVIEQLVLQNTQYLLHKLREIPAIQIHSNTNTDRLSGIIAFRHDNIASEKLYNELMHNKVICAMRHGNVRFSPHYYTTNEVIDEAILILKNIISQQ